MPGVIGLLAATTDNMQHELATRRIENPITTSRTDLWITGLELSDNASRVEFDDDLFGVLGDPHVIRTIRRLRRLHCRCLCFCHSYNPIRAYWMPTISLSVTPISRSLANHE